MRESIGSAIQLIITERVPFEGEGGSIRCLGRLGLEPEVDAPGARLGKGARSPLPSEDGSSLFSRMIGGPPRCSTHRWRLLRWTSW